MFLRGSSTITRNRARAAGGTTTGGGIYNDGGRLFGPVAGRNVKDNTPNDIVNVA